MKKSVYAARFEHAPQRPAWMLVRADSASPVRVVEGNDWLLEFTVAHTPENTVKSYAGRLSKWWGWCVDSGIDPIPDGGHREHRKLELGQCRLPSTPHRDTHTEPVRSVNATVPLRR